MPIVVDIDVMLARRRMSVGELAERIGITPANLAVLSTLADAGTLIVSDEHAHASLIDGCRLSRAAVSVSRHNDVDHVAELLALITA